MLELNARARWRDVIGCGTGLAALLLPLAPVQATAAFWQDDVERAADQSEEDAVAEEERDETPDRDDREDAIDTEDTRSLSVIGQAEHVLLADGGLRLRARVDTGATSSSIDARDIETFERNGDQWVRFEVRNDEGDSVVMEREIADTVIIIGAGEDKEKRSVVELDVCVADVLERVEINLANREGLEYRMLVGRDLLRSGGFLVNVAQKYSHEPQCEGVIGE